MTYPEIEYGKIYRVKTRIAYSANGRVGDFWVFSRKVVRYITRWRRNEDSYLISESHNVIGTYFHTLPIMDLDVRDGGEGLEPLFTDIEEMMDLDLFVHWQDGKLRIMPRDSEFPSCYPLFSMLERAPYDINFQYYFGIHIYGFGLVKPNDKERKVHFESSTYFNSDTFRCSILVDRDCNILATSYWMI